MAESWRSAPTTGKRRSSGSMTCPVRLCLGGSRLGEATAFRSGQATASESCFSRIEKATLASIGSEPTALAPRSASRHQTRGRRTFRNRGRRGTRDSRSVRWRARVCRCGRSRSRKRRRYRLATYGRRLPLNSEFSPDGRWLAYTLRTGNLANVYVEPYPATGAKYQITTGNGHHPVWLPDGKGLSVPSWREPAGRGQRQHHAEFLDRQSCARDRGGTTDGRQPRLKVLRHHAGWCRLPDSYYSVGIPTRISDDAGDPDRPQLE